MSDMSSSVPPPPGTPAKKGLGPLGWILIGCGGLIVVGGLVFGGLVMAGGWFAKKKLAEFDKNPTLAAAKLVVQLNPDLEVVSSDEKNGTLTVKNKKTGEVVTINAEDAKNGHIEFKTKDGTASIDASSQDGTFKVTNDKGEVATWGAGTAANLPSWLPSYPGGTVQGTMDTTNAEGRSAAFTMNTKDSTSKVLDYYESQFKAAGFKVDKSTYTANNQTGGSITATSDDQKRTATIMIGASGEETSAVITFQEKK